MRCLLLSNLLVFRPLNYVLKLSTVTQKVTVGIFMAVIPVVYRYAVDCVCVSDHSIPNLNQRTYRLCSRGAKETEEHLLLNCTLHSVFRVDLLQSVNQFC